MIPYELVEIYAKAWMMSEYDADPEHILEWLADEDLNTEADKERLEGVDLAELAQKIADYVTEYEERHKEAYHG